MKIIIDVRAIHFFDDRKRITYALREDDPEELLHDAVVRLGLEREHYSLYFFFPDDVLWMDEVFCWYVSISTDNVLHCIFARILEMPETTELFFTLLHM